LVEVIAGSTFDYSEADHLDFGEVIDFRGAAFFAAPGFASTSTFISDSGECVFSRSAIFLAAMIQSKRCLMIMSTVQSNLC
jgi:hypothetical protein